MNDLVLLTCNGNKPLATKIAKYLNKPLTSAVVDAFPDGETRVQIQENIRGADVFIIQPTSSPSNQNLMELFITIDAAKRASAGHITAVIPYFGYSRQDRKDAPRVPITAKLVANLLTEAGANRVLTMDLHSPQIQGFFDIPVDHLYALPVAYKHFIQSHKEMNYVIGSPDLGGMKRAAAYAKAFKTSIAIISKERNDALTTKAEYLIGDVKDRNILLIDDMTESGGTLRNAALLMKDRGAKSITSFVTHGMINNPHAIQRLNFENILAGGLTLIDRFVCTNTTNVDVAAYSKLDLQVLDVSSIFGESIRRIHHQESVTQLFEIE